MLNSVQPEAGTQHPLLRRNWSDTQVLPGQRPLAQLLHTRLYLNWLDAHVPLRPASGHFQGVSTFLFLSKPLQMCQHHQVYITMCMCVSIFTIILKELTTQFATPLDPSNDAKLDHSSGTRWPLCKQVCPLNGTVIYPKPGYQLLYTPMTGEMEMPWVIPLPYAFHSSISSNVDATHASTNHQMIWSTSYHHVIVLVHWSWPHSLFTVASIHRRQVLLKLHRHTRSLASKPLTCPSHLQLVRRAEPHLDLLHLGHMTLCHVSYAMSSSIIICVSLLPSSSHLHCHGICCSHTCICGLIICVSHINTINPPNFVTQLPKPNKDLSGPYQAPLWRGVSTTYEDWSPSCFQVSLNQGTRWCHDTDRWRGNCLPSSPSPLQKDPLTLSREASFHSFHSIQERNRSIKRREALGIRY
jgi:hypothetical protein